MFLGVVALDQVTKVMIAGRLALGERIPVIPDLLDLTHVHNTGMAFGLLSSADIPFKSVVVTLLSLLAMAAVGYYALSSPASERLTRVGLMLILGGAAGNIIDRLRLGYVVDFIDVYYRGSHWPAFNVADSAICVGVGLLLLDSLTNRSTAESPTDGDAVAAGRAEQAEQGDS